MFRTIENQENYSHCVWFFFFILLQCLCWTKKKCSLILFLATETTKFKRFRTLCSPLFDFARMKMCERRYMWRDVSEMSVEYLGADFQEWIILAYVKRDYWEWENENSMIANNSGLNRKQEDTTRITKWARSNRSLATGWLYFYSIPFLYRLFKHSDRRMVATKWREQRQQQLQVSSYRFEYWPKCRNMDFLFSFFVTLNRSIVHFRVLWVHADRLSLHNNHQFFVTHFFLLCYFRFSIFSINMYWNFVPLTQWCFLLPVIDVSYSLVLFSLGFPFDFPSALASIFLFKLQSKYFSILAFMIKLTFPLLFNSILYKLRISFQHKKKKNVPTVDDWMSFYWIVSHWLYSCFSDTFAWHTQFLLSLYDLRNIVLVIREQNIVWCVDGRDKIKRSNEILKELYQGCKWEVIRSLTHKCIDWGPHYEASCKS